MEDVGQSDIRTGIVSADNGTEGMRRQSHGNALEQVDCCLELPEFIRWAGEPCERRES